MRSKFLKILFLFLSMLILPLCTQKAAFATQLKISDLLFDNSDNIILVKSLITPASSPVPGVSVNAPPGITKGVLTNPNRVFFDIPNAILTVPQRSWSLKNSKLEEVRISQFSVNPDVVRVVIKTGSIDPKDFVVIKGDSGDNLIIKYGEQIATGVQFETVYKNFEPQNVFEALRTETISQAVGVPDDTKKGNITIGETAPSRAMDKNIITLDTKEYRLNSKFFTSRVTPAGDGLKITGVGAINLLPQVALTNPTRLVFDIQNATMASALKNKNFPIGTIRTGGGVPMPSANSTAVERDVLRLGQFEKNIVRVVIEGNGAKDYRAVVSPDLQNMFIAKKPDILGTKLTQNLAAVEFYSVQNLDPTLNLLTVNFNYPVAFSIFEEAEQLHFDMQNVADFNKISFDEMVKNPKFTNTKVTKIASEKTRLSFPINDKTGVNAQISNDGKVFKIYFKEGAINGKKTPLQPVSTQQKPTISVTPKLELLKLPQSTMSNYFKVVIDPGHGGSDVGATRENVYEKDINLPVAKLVRDYLQKEKVQVEMTMETDKTVSLQERSDFSNGLVPDLFVSIHCNSSMNPEIFGIETHWWQEKSVGLAKTIHAQLASDKNLKKWGTRDRGLFKSQFYVINHTEAPSVLLELGFMSNPNELHSLIDKNRQQEIAKAIAEGIMSYLKSNKGEKGKE